MFLAVGQEFAGFRVMRKLAEGGMGVVYVAEHLRTGHERALKLMRADVKALDSKSVERFQREARVGSLIKSDHLVEVVDAGHEGHSLWIAMELLEGETLEERIRLHGPLSREPAQAVFTQLVHGLGRAHEKGLVHRDLKPENIFLELPRRADVAFTVKILDFGIAVVIHTTTEETKSRVGTPLWMAPEQIEGKSIGPACDVFSLGLIAFYVLTGKLYWVNANKEDYTLQSLFYEIVMTERERASVRNAELGGTLPLPAGFDDWLERCLQHDPADRFQDAEAAIRMLLRVLQSTTDEVVDRLSDPSQEEVASADAASVADATDSTASAQPAPETGPAPLSDSGSWGETRLLDRAAPTPELTESGAAEQELSSEASQAEGGEDAANPQHSREAAMWQAEPPHASDEPAAQVEPNDAPSGDAATPTSWRHRTTTNPSVTANTADPSKGTAMGAWLMLGLAICLVGAGVLVVWNASQTPSISVQASGSQPPATVAQTAAAVARRPADRKSVAKRELPPLIRDPLSSLPVELDDSDSETAKANLAIRRPNVWPPRPHGPAPTSGASGAPGGGFDQHSAAYALAVAAQRASKACKIPGGPGGSGAASVTFAPSGNVSSSVVLGNNFDGTSIEGCVTAHFGRARVAPFAGSAVTMTQTFTIEGVLPSSPGANPYKADEADEAPASATPKAAEPTAPPKDITDDPGF